MSNINCSTTQFFRQYTLPHCFFLKYCLLKNFFNNKEVSRYLLFSGVLVHGPKIDLCFTQYRISMCCSSAIVWDSEASATLIQHLTSNGRPQPSLSIFLQFASRCETTLYCSLNHNF